MVDIKPWCSCLCSLAGDRLARNVPPLQEDTSSYNIISKFPAPPSTTTTSPARPVFGHPAYLSLTRPSPWRTGRRGIDMLAPHTSLEPTRAVRPALELPQQHLAMACPLLLLDMEPPQRLATGPLHQATELPRLVMERRPHPPTDSLQPKIPMR